MVKKTKIQRKKKTGQYWVNIPKSYAEIKGLRKGNVVYWDEDKEGFLRLRWRRRS